MTTDTGTARPRMKSSDRPEIERELAAERERLRITLSSIGDGVISTDAEGRVVFLNPVAEALTGWPLAEAQGRPITEVFRIINETSRAPVENPAVRALVEGRVVQLANHTLLVARDGREIPIDDSGAPLRDATGAVQGAVLVFRDVTERRRVAHDQLRLAAIVTSSDDAIVSKTLDGVIRTWNAGAERIFGFTAEEAIGKPITIIIPPDRLDEEREILARLRRGERVEHFETVRRTKDGRYLDISVSVSPLRSADGTIVGASKVARDITHHKRAVGALKDTAERLALALNAAQLGDWSWDAATDMVTFSPRAGEIFGIPPGPVMTWSAMQALLHPHDRDRARLAVEAAVAARNQYDVEYRVLRRDGAEVWISAKGMAQYRPDGAPIGMYGVVQDISSRKRLEHELEARAAQLAEADRQKDDFIALLAHELRNPLAPIRTGLQVMRLAGDDAEKMAKARATMDRQIEHMVRLIDDLLDISRIKRNKLHLKLQRVLLSEVMTHAVEAAAPTIEAAGHRLEVSLPKEPLWLDGDLVRLSQVLSNLLTNSAKYTRHGTGRIELTAQREGPGVVIRVTDNGIGIPPEALPRIFDMFAQVDRPVEHTTGGLGIGLALVKGLVEAHGGTVTGQSEGAGKGSTFTVRLPAVAAAAEATERAAASAPAPQFKGKRVLVADDNRDAALLLAELVELLGNEVHVAYDGLEAVSAAERLRPDLILMDVGMPRLSGLEAARKIREQPWSTTTTIVALTGWGQDSDKQRSKEAGCDSHLVKPVGMPQLEALLESLVKGEPPPA